MQQLITLTWFLLQFLIGFNLILPFILYLIFIIRKKKDYVIKIPSFEPDYAIIVTAYEQTNLLPAVVDSLLSVNYSNFIIYIVADKCDITNLSFSSKKVILLSPPEIIASNTGSHFYAINNFIRPHERLIIIDSDNLVDKEFIHHFNIYFSKGFKAVQGVRKAKNSETIYAHLDAARDFYYHFYDGEVLFNIGSSATLAGSGMAFTIDLYKSSLNHLNIKGAGFDKVLQYEIVKNKDRIAFAKEAIVYDEKTSNTDQLVHQRARWINTWFRYFTYGFDLLKKGILQKNWNQFLFGLVILRPPLFIFLMLSICMLIANVWLQPVAALIWLILLLLFCVSFVIALIAGKAEKVIYSALLKAPKFIFYQLLSLSKVKNANKHSVATKHQFSEKNI